MTLKIDRVGRIVLPKPVRERLGLTAGSRVKVTERAGALTLELVGQKPSLRRKGKFLIHVASAPAGFDVVAAIEESREERIRQVLGGR